jgi:ABC-type transport system involved in multi-copper enzyme maturation permease subunit
MNNVWILARNSWQENVRGKFFALSLVFAALILYISVLLGALAADQETRVLYDFGLSFIELMGLAGALYGATTVIMRELETKTIYMILTRPVSRGQYLMGRFLGLALSAAAAMAAMAAFHLVLLFAKGWKWDNAYLLGFVGAYLKVLVTAALAAALTLFSSSVLTALSITLILWTLGHFLPELRYMMAWGPSQWAIVPLRALSVVIPDLQLLNFRDQLAAEASRRPPVWLAVVYAPAYAAIWLAVARALLKKKEF